MHKGDKGKNSHLKFKSQHKKNPPILPPENYIHKENYFYLKKTKPKWNMWLTLPKVSFSKTGKIQILPADTKTDAKSEAWSLFQLNVQGIILYLPSSLGMQEGTRKPKTQPKQTNKQIKTY